MALRLTFDPQNPKQNQAFSLDGRQYLVRSVWKDRLRGWYLDVRLADGTGVALGARVAPGGLLVPDMNRWDPTAEAGGLLVAIGRSDYAREDLGQVGGVNVAYMTRAEWDAVREAAAARTAAFEVLVTP